MKNCLIIRNMDQENSVIFFYICLVFNDKQRTSEENEEQSKLLRFLFWLNG